MSKKAIAAVGGISKLRARCYGAVERWEWYAGWLARDPIPHASEAAGFGTPRRLKKEPADKRKAAKVGIDAAGRTVVRQTYFVHEGTAYPHDELFHYEDDEIITVRLDTTMAGEPQQLGAVRELKVRDGRVVAAGTSRYHYDRDGLLVRAEHQHGTAVYGYDPLGRLLSIDHGREKRFMRKPADVGMASTMARIEELLVDRIPAVLAANGPREPVLVFALVHSLGSTALPPLIGLMLERERDALLATTDPERAFWDPIEWSSFEDERLEVGSPELRRACELAHRLCVDADTIEPVRRMLWKVVARLHDQLPRLLRPSEHFVALVMHAEHEDLSKDLTRAKRTLPAATKKALADVLP